jgi:superfamily I DNA and/or RNA helicase
MRTGDYEGTREDMRKHMLQTHVPNPLANYTDARRALREADLICTTTGSAGTSLFDKMNFDYLIMDEASQVIVVLMSGYGTCSFNRDKY